MKKREVVSNMMEKDKWAKFGRKLFSMMFEFFPKIDRIIPNKINIEILIKLPS